MLEHVKGFITYNPQSIDIDFIREAISYAISKGWKPLERGNIFIVRYHF
jgi:hypothetical protein